jgi:4-hydroxy-tetrahydrodipicolinate synthase
LLEDEGADYEGLRRNVTFLADAGIEVVCVGGNTGEFWSLTREELQRMLEVVRAAAPAALLVAGVGGPVDAAAADGNDALERGADVVMLHEPPNPYAGPVGHGRYVAAVASAIDGPVVLYPRSAHFDERALAEFRSAPNIVGVKYGRGDVRAFAGLVAKAPELIWICGLAESWAPAFWAFGAEGFTSGLANVAPHLSLRLRDALQSGDFDTVRDLAAYFNPFEHLRSQNGESNNVAAVKMALETIGLSGGPLRPPLSELSDADQRALLEIVGRWPRPAFARPG